MNRPRFVYVCRMTTPVIVQLSSRGGLGEFMRLGFSFYEAEGIEEGLHRLGQCL
ncbi:MAG: hypothetical protein FD146_1270 [Anaerolineaceae bacterium]|nr:MAG: hypothetical protein FD146_1270 [Anaerolineaceae bacterium]